MRRCTGRPHCEYVEQGGVFRWRSILPRRGRTACFTKQARSPCIGRPAGTCLPRALRYPITHSSTHCRNVTPSVAKTWPGDARVGELMAWVVGPVGPASKMSSTAGRRYRIAWCVRGVEGVKQGWVAGLRDRCHSPPCRPTNQPCRPKREPAASPLGIWREVHIYGSYHTQCWAGHTRIVAASAGGSTSGRGGRLLWWEKGKESRQVRTSGARFSLLHSRPGRCARPARVALCMGAPISAAYSKPEEYLWPAQRCARGVGHGRPSQAPPPVGCHQWGAQRGQTGLCRQLYCRHAELQTQI